MMTVQRVRVGKLITNCYILRGDRTAAVIDPGGAPEKILAACGGLPIELILLTHGHLDHTAALGELCKSGAPKVYLHPADLPFLNDDSLRAPLDTDSYPELQFAPPLPMNEGDRIPFEDETFRVLHTPGHTPGSVCLYAEKEQILFSGDTVFQNTCGRTDLPGGDENAMHASLTRLWAELPGEVKILPGHGFATAVGIERDGGNA